MAEQTEKICTIGSVIFYVDPKSLGPLNFLGKKIIRFPVKSEHSSWTVFRRKFAEFAGLKAEAEKRGLGSCIEFKFSRLEKGKDGSKAFAINTQELKKLLPRFSVLNKDRMDINCILHLSKDSVLDRLRTVDRVVHSVLPDSYKISDTNKVGLYPHLVAVCSGEYGNLLVLDYAPLKNLTRLLEVRPHVPADVKVVGECHDGAKSLTYCDGIAYVSCPSGMQLVYRE